MAKFVRNVASWNKGQRSTHCHKGHPRTPANSKAFIRGNETYLACLICRAEVLSANVEERETYMRNYRADKTARRAAARQSRRTERLDRAKTLQSAGTISAEYVAGFFDGEGCVNITVTGKHRRCTLRLYIANTDYEHMVRLQSQYGGHLSRRPHRDRPHWKPFCTVSWTNREAAILLDQIGPFIVLKQRQIALARDFLAMRDDPNRFDVNPQTGLPRSERKWIRKIKDSVLAQEFAIKSQMHVLNKKGVQPLAIQ